jgi:nitrogen fixation/metabolism regulation signal transduction histidine kinase
MENKGETYEPTVKVTSSEVDGSISVGITDNGNGMEDETLSQAFEPLFTTRARGTGLGLAIVKKIIDEHGGSISLDTKLNHGTKVSFVIPLAGSLAPQKQ